MNTRISFIIPGLFLLAGPARAQIYDTNNDAVATYAGYGIPAYVDGQGLLTAFNNPTQIVSDTASNLYVWDSNNQRIRKITPDRTVSTFAGGGTSLEGYGTNVSLSWGSVGTMVMDNSNRIWLAMAAGYWGGVTYLLTVETNGNASIVNGGLPDLNTGSGICFDSANNLYYSGGNRIYRYNPGSGVAQPFAGSGIAGYFDGQGTQLTAFSSPAALACDQADNIYVWDSGNGLIRRVDQNQNVTTIAGGGGGYWSPAADGNGTSAGFSGINTMFFDHYGNLYLMCGSCVRKMDAQLNVITLAGSFYQVGYANGPGNTALMNSQGGCLSPDMILIADSGNNRIRNLTFNAPAQPVAPANLQLKTYPGLQITGSVGRTYQIQSSPDMNNWNPVATVLLNSSPYLWIDQNPAAGNKFYRAVLLP